jgi:hypothetical protein
MVGGQNLVRTDVMRLEKRLDAVDLELKQQTEILVTLGKQSVRLDSLEEQVAELRKRSG